MNAGFGAKPIELFHHIYMRKVEWENMQRVAIMLVATIVLNTKEISKSATNHFQISLAFCSKLTKS